MASADKRTKKMQRLITKHALHSSPNRFFCCKGRSTASVLTEPNKLRPPSPKKLPTTISAHGKTWDDPYQWMSNLQDPDLSRYLQQENQYAESFMSDTLQFQQQLQAEMQSRMPSEVSTTAERWGPWLYYQRIPEGKEFPILCRRLEGRGSLAESVLRFVRGCPKEEVLLDWNQIAEQFGYVHVGTCRISPDHHFLAYTLDVTGRELFMLRIKDLKTGAIFSKSNVEGVVSLAWAKDSCTLLYTVSDDSQRPHRVFGSRIKSEDEDILLFEEKDRSCCVDITNTKDYQFITVNSNSRTSSEVYLMNAADPDAGLQRIRKRVAGVQYFVEHHHGFFYILTNAPLGNGNMISDNYHLTRCTVEDISSDKWQNVIQADQDVMIEDMDIFDKHLVLFLHDGGTPVICSLHMPLHVDSKNGKQLQELNPWLLPLPADTCTVVPASNHDFESSVFRAVISSPVMPEAIVDYDLLRQSFTIVQQEKVMDVRSTIGKTWSSMNCEKYSHTSEVPELLHMEADNFKRAEAYGSWSDLAEMYTCEQRKVLSHDGFNIPLTVVYSRKIKQDGKNPGLIQGYGAYGEVLDKQWCSDRISLLDRGWVIAFADVRGGGGGGKFWHNEGMGLQKLNSIYDFIACGKYLVDEGLVDKHRLTAMGFSAGGLLVGAAANMCPELFQTIILKVPFLDICNTLLDTSLPLTVLDYEEFGDPRNLIDFETIKSYSPYDNVRKGVCYPAMLVTASFHDSRVGVWEAAKWVARVREYTASNSSKPVLLKTNMNSGHFGEGGRYEHCKETAFEYAFLMKMMGT